jgi:methyl-accepting chemotaxis protein
LTILVERKEVFGFCGPIVDETHPYKRYCFEKMGNDRPHHFSVNHLHLLPLRVMIRSVFYISNHFSSSYTYNLVEYDKNKKIGRDFSMRWTVRKKLYAGFFTVFIILIVMIAVNFYQMKEIDRTYRTLLDEDVQRLVMTKNLLATIKKAQESQLGYLLAGDKTSLHNFTNAHKEYQRTSKQLMPQIDDPKAKALLKELDKLEREFYDFSDHLFESKNQNQQADYLMALATGRQMVQDVETKVTELVAYQEKLLKESEKHTLTHTTSAQSFVLTLGIISIAAGLIVAFFISGSISKPVIAIANAAEKMATGDLTTTDINIKNKDELGDLAASFQKMAQNLRDLIQQVAENADQVAAASEQLTASAEQTSKATEQITVTMQEVSTSVDKQAKSVEETSKTAQEMSDAVHQVANNTQHASALATEAAAKATNGERAVQVAVEQMNSINNTVRASAEVVKQLGVRSQEIGQITSTITAIAERTNLLALNAAIEAARAGEHGRGFAVVADEVRKLAEQSAQSAQQIAQLITTIQEETNKAVHSMEAVIKEVNAGIEVVHTAGDSFTQIKHSVRDVTDHVQDITASIQQMAAGAEQVVQSMQLIAQISETASAGAQEVSAATEEQLAAMEEISSSASSLSHMAEQLQTLIQKFKTH